MTLDECLNKIRTSAAILEEAYSISNDSYAGLAAKIKEANEEFKRTLRLAPLQAVADRATMEFRQRYEWLVAQEKARAEFKADFEAYCASSGIVIRKISANNPRANG
mgnify:CR=1 FL=1